MLNNYQFIPENKGKIKEVAFVAKADSDDIPMLESFVKILPHAKLNIFAPDNLELNYKKIHTNLIELKEFSKKNSDKVNLIILPALYQHDYSLFDWARNSLICLENGKDSIITPTLLSGKTYHNYSLNFKSELNNFDVNSLIKYAPLTNIKEVSPVKYFNSADVLVTNKLVVIDYKVLINFILNNKEASKIVPIKKYSEFWSNKIRKKVEANKESLKEIINNELSSNIGNRDLVIAPSFGEVTPYYDLDVALVPYDERKFFIANNINSKVRLDLEEQGLELTNYPCNLWYGMKKPFFGIKFADINVLEENYKDKKIVYLPNRIYVSSTWVINDTEPKGNVREYEKSKQKVVELWEKKGFEVKFIDFTRDNCTGPRCAFQVMNREYY